MIVNWTWDLCVCVCVRQLASKSDYAMIKKSILELVFWFWPRFIVRWEMAKREKKYGNPHCRGILFEDFQTRWLALSNCYKTKLILDNREKFEIWLLNKKNYGLKPPYTNLLSQYTSRLRVNVCCIWESSG